MLSVHGVHLSFGVHSLIHNLSFGLGPGDRLGLDEPRILLLDEPTNHLDIPSRERFEQALSGFEGAVLAVSHDRYFVERFATQRWDVAGARCRVVG